MAGQPRTRAKRAKEALKEIEDEYKAQLAKDKEPEAYPPDPATPNRGRGASPERMREITRLRMEAAKTDPSKKGGRPKGSGGRPMGISREEAEQRALDDLTPKALKVLRDQLNSLDEAVRQRAAIKVIEYRMGKPTQRIEQDSRISVIRYESAAWRYGNEPVIEAEAIEEIEP